MENEKILNKKPAPQELPDESLDTVTGGGEPKYVRAIQLLKYSYEFDQEIVGIPQGETKALRGIITRKTFFCHPGMGYVAAYDVYSVHPKKRVTRIAEHDILYVISRY